MSLAKTLKNSKSIINYFSPNIGNTLDDRLFSQLMAYTGEVLNLSRKELITAAASVSLFRWKPLTRETLQCIALRLAANTKFLRENVEIPYWEGEQVDACLFCKGISYSKDSKAENRYLLLHCIVVSGIAAGLQVTCKKSANSINYIMYKYMKTGRGNYEAEEIARTFFKCTIEELGNDLIEIKEVSVTPYMKDINKKTLEKRYEPLKCKTPNKLCWTCKKTISECPNACKYKQENK